MISSFSHGHKIKYINEKWVYIDIQLPISITRPCKKCKEFPTKEGYDSCLGHIEGVSSACCGHGVEKPYKVKDTTNANV